MALVGKARWIALLIGLTACGDGTSSPEGKLPADSGVVADTFAARDALDAHQSAFDGAGDALDLHGSETLDDVAPPSVGDAMVPCHIVKELACGESLRRITNGGDDSTHVVGWYACQPQPASLYAASPERTYRFTAPYDTRVLLSETTDTSMDVAVIRDLGAGCLAGPNACVGVDHQGVAWDAKAGESFLLVFDSHQGSVEEFSAQLDCCVPSCEESECGSDGCGGNCGVCGAGDACDGGHCVSGVDLTCNPSISLTCGSHLQGEHFQGPETTQSIDSLSCTVTGMLGPERAYSLSFPAASLVSVQVTAAGDPGVSAFLLDASVAACDASQCLAGGGDGVSFLAEPGALYTLIVESAPDSPAPFDVLVDCCQASCASAECGGDGCGGSCGSCGADKTCQAGACEPLLPQACKAVAALDCGGEPVTIVMGGSNLTDNVTAAACTPIALDGPEAALKFTSSENAVVLFSLESAEPVETSTLLLLEGQGAGCHASNCVASAPLELSAVVTANQPYYLLLEGLGSALGQEIVVRAECCSPSCEGKACGPDGCGGSCGQCAPGHACDSGACVASSLASCVGAIPLACGETLVADLSNHPKSTNLWSSYACNPFDYAGPELTFDLQVPSAAVVQLQVTSVDGSDLDLFQLLAGKGGCSPDGCQAWDGGKLVLQATAAEDILVVVDGFMGAAGPFELMAECCFPSCAAEACGQADGCGGNCGCEAGFVCAEQQCVPVAPGGACASPLAVGMLPATLDSTTSGASVDGFHTHGACGSGGDAGKGQADVVFTLTAPLTGLYVVSVSPVAPGNAPTLLYALGDCEEVAESCLGFSALPGGPTIDLPLQAGQTVFLVVDGLESGDEGAFTLHAEGPL